MDAKSTAIKQEQLQQIYWNLFSWINRSVFWARFHLCLWLSFAGQRYILSTRIYFKNTLSCLQHHRAFGVITNIMISSLWRQNNFVLMTIFSHHVPGGLVWYKHDCFHEFCGLEYNCESEHTDSEYSDTPPVIVSVGKIQFPLLTKRPILYIYSIKSTSGPPVLTNVNWD